MRLMPCWEWSLHRLTVTIFILKEHDVYVDHSSADLLLDSPFSLPLLFNLDHPIDLSPKGAVKQATLSKMYAAGIG